MLLVDFGSLTGRRAEGGDMDAVRYVILSYVMLIILLFILLTNLFNSLNWFCRFCRFHAHYLPYSYLWLHLHLSQPKLVWSHVLWHSFLWHNVMWSDTPTLLVLPAYWQSNFFTRVFQFLVINLTWCFMMVCYVMWLCAQDLRGLFREAQMNNAVLFFDECEVVFRTRNQGGDRLLNRWEKERRDEKRKGRKGG